MLVAGDFEGQPGKRLAAVGIDLHGPAFILRRMSLEGAYVLRRRQIGNYRVQKRLDAAVLQRRTAQNGLHLALDGPGPQGAANHLGADRLVFQVGVHQLVVVFGHHFDDMFVLHLGLGPGVAFQGRLLELHATGIDVLVGLQFQEVDVATHLGPIEQRQNHRKRIGIEPLMNVGHDAVEVRPHAVQFVDEHQSGDFVTFGLSPDRLTLGLDAANCAENGDRPVKNTKRPLHLGRKVHVPRRVDQVDGMVFPRAGRGRRMNGDAAGLLFRVIVHHRGPVVDLAHLVGLAGIEKYPFGNGRLAGIDVGHDADVANFFQATVVHNESSTISIGISDQLELHAA